MFKVYKLIQIFLDIFNIFKRLKTKTTHDWRIKMPKRW